MRTWLLAIIAAALGLAIALVDARPTWDDTGIEPRYRASAQPAGSPQVVLTDPAGPDPDRTPTFLRHGVPSIGSRYRSRP
jgi:hypothetical protein